MFRELTPEQAEAIDTDRNRLVTACPGSGKTRTALARIIRGSIAFSETFESVLALTFTNGARTELDRRVTQHCDSTIASSISTYTFHGFVLQELVRPFGALIVEDGLQLAVPGNIAYEKAVATVATRQAIDKDSLRSSLKNCNRLSTGEPSKNGRALGMRESAIVSDFWVELSSLGYVDFSGALHIGHLLLTEHPWIGRGISAKFPLVVVDEYQDCSEPQLALLQDLKRGGSVFFLVGDYFQSLFEFAGANQTSVADFVEEIHADSRTLSGSHRCARAILDIAERIFPRSLECIGEALRVPGLVKICALSSPFDDLARFVDDCFNAGIPSSQIAVVSAWNRRLDEIVTEVSSRGIGAVIGKVQRPDDEWLESFVESMILADPPGNVEDIESFCEALLAVVERLSERPYSVTKMRAEIYAAVTANISPSEPLAGSFLEALPKVVERSVFFLVSTCLFTKQELRAAESRLEAACADYRSKGRTDESIDALRERLRPDDKIRAYTYQGIKGLEFDAVAVLDICNPYVPFPKERDLSNTARLLYVGVTRAKSRLMLHIPDDESESSFAPVLLGTVGANALYGGIFR